MQPNDKDPSRTDDFEKRIRYVTLPLLFILIFFSGALGSYVGIGQDHCTKNVGDFDLLYHLSLSLIPACVVILFYILNLYGFLMSLSDWFRISSTFLHLLLYVFYGLLISILCIILNDHLEVDYNDSDCLDKFDQKHQKNAAWAAVVFCAVGMALIQVTPWN